MPRTKEPVPQTGITVLGIVTRNRDLGAVLPDAGKMALAHLHAKIAMSVLDPEASRRVSDIEWEKGWSVLLAKRQLVLYGPARTSLFHLFWLDSRSGARTVQHLSSDGP